MKTLKTEVKTFATIVFDTADLWEIIDTYKKSDFYKSLYPNAFKNFMYITAEMPEENVIKVMKQIGVLGNSETYNLIAKLFLFDGWHNAGVYNERTNTYTMVVYNYGDTLNH